MNEEIVITPKRRKKDQAITSAWANSLVDSIARLSRRVEKYRQKAAGHTEQMPFYLSSKMDGTDAKYRVSLFRSTITNGTNGAAIDLSLAGFDTWVTITATSYIYLEAAVDEYFVTSGWTLTNSTSATDADEVATSGSPPEQDYLRLLIGKVVITDSKITAIYQSAWSAYRIVNGLLNGKYVVVLEPCPAHSSFTTS